jgi:hypothetical protein
MPATRLRSRLLLGAAAGLLAAASMTGCSGSDHQSGHSAAKSSPADKVNGADTKCSDYVTMNKADQIKVIQQTSKEIDKEDVSSDQAASVIADIKKFCKQPDLKDGTMRDIAGSND